MHHAESPPGGTKRQSLATFDNKNDSDADMDDVATEAPTSPQIVSPPMTPSDEDDNADDDVDVPNTRTQDSDDSREPIKIVKIKRVSADQSFVATVEENRGTKPKAAVNFKRESSPAPCERNSKPKRSCVKELQNLLHDDPQQPGRISKRRSTMATHSNTTVLSNTSGRKRRLSQSSRKMNEIECTDALLVSLNRDRVNDTSKRMRVERGPSKANAAAAQVNVTSNRNSTTKPTTPGDAHKNGGSLNANVVAISDVDMTVTATVILTSPSTQKVRQTNRRDRSTKALTTTTTTPRITQFFTQRTSTPVQMPKAAAPSAASTTSARERIPAPAPAPATSLTCGKCSIILNSRNELDFHTKSHEMKCCVKCKEPIDHDDPMAISSHMVSCFLLGNTIPSDTLNRFFKVKVDLDRLTPTKIKQIQKNLRSADATASSIVRRRNDNSQSRRDSQKGPSSDSDDQLRSTRRESTSASDNAQNYTNEKSVDGTNDQGRSHQCCTQSIVW